MISLCVSFTSVFFPITGLKLFHDQLPTYSLEALLCLRFFQHCGFRRVNGSVKTELSDPIGIVEKVLYWTRNVLYYSLLEHL